jgi:UDP-N-acetylmuramate dehydrogenase
MYHVTNTTLKPYNSFGVDVEAVDLYKVESVGDVEILHKDSILKNAIILGKGSNTLFTKSPKQPVVVMNIMGKKIVKETDKDVLIRVGCGEDWDEFVEYCVEQNWTGVENLSLIPGGIGASVVQNIGAYGVEVSQVVEKVEVFKQTTGKIVELSAADCKFGYRDSIFKQKIGKTIIVLSVTFRLLKNGPLNVDYEDVIQQMGKRNVTLETLTARDIRTIISDIRNSKLPLPSILGNAGSFFKNPQISNQQYDTLLLMNPEIKGYISGDFVKLSAGWLIEKCGYKGWKSKDRTYGVYPQHALAIVNYGGAKGSDIWKLAQDIQTSVKERFGVDLEPEVIII